MKHTILFALLAALALSACQNEKTPAAQVPAESVATASDQAAPSPSSQSEALPVKSTVAVTKPEPADSANSIRAAMKQLGSAKAFPTATVQQSADAGKPTKTVSETVKNTVLKSGSQAKRAAEKPAKAIRTAVKKALKTAPAVPVAAKPAVAAPTVVAMVGDASRGKHIARKCQACHNFTAKKKVGPGLKGVFGRRAGIMPDMRYSKALKAGGWVWNEKNLHMWDCNSRKAIKVLSGNPSAKTKMPPQHICDATKLADLTAFLKTL